MKITAKMPTKLKKAPIASGFLTAAELIDVPAGKTYGVMSAIAAKANHTQVTLDFGAGTWFVFNEHWSGLNAQLVSKATAEHIFERSLSDDQLKDLNDCLHRFEINTKARMQLFLSQIGAESSGMQFLKENDPGWYIPERFNLPAIAASDGGYRYRGGGALQLSMPDNYLAFSKFMGDPEIYNQGCPYVAENYPASSGGFWWTELNDMNKLCDSGADIWAISRAVNLGNAWSSATPNGMSERDRYYKRCCDVIGD